MATQVETIYAIYVDDKVVALVCDDPLYINPTSISKQFLDDRHLAPPYPGAKNCYRMPEDMWDDADWLGRFVFETAVLVPPPKPKRPKK